MKHRLLFIIASLINIPLFAQVAGIVSVPALEVESKVQTSILATIQASSYALEEAQEKAEQLYQTVSWIWDLESFDGFLDMMQSVSCTSSNVKTNLNIAIALNLTDCIEEFRYKKSINDLKLAIDLTNMILDESFRLSNGERGEIMEEAVTKYGDAQNELYELNKVLEREINAEIYAERLSGGYSDLIKIKAKRKY